MNLLFLKGFNNYFNRKIKKYTNLDDYKANSATYYSFSDINFNPNDGISTQQIVGSENQKNSSTTPLNWETEGSPDYLVCFETVPGTIIVDGEEVETAVDQIVSRWFVMESVRTRAGQYQLALKRDVIADHLEQILTNPCFVEKGYVSANSPLIFNEEGVSLNQIKQSETMLKDETGIPWIVMYIAKNYRTTYTDPDDPNTGTEHTVPIEGQMVLDTSQAIDWLDLPWNKAGDTTLVSAPTVGRTYRMKGASNITLSPILANYVDEVGWGKYLTDPIRVSMRYYYNSGLGRWQINKAISYVEEIGTYSHLNDSPLSLFYSTILLNKAIGLTPATDSVRWNATGIMVPTFWRKNRDRDDHQETLNAGGWLLNFGGLSNENTAANRAAIISYLNGKMNWLKTSVLHSSVPGQTNMEAYVGGNQTFVPAVDLLSYNGKIVKHGVNYYKIKITRQNNYKTPIDYFIKDEQGVIHPNNNNELGGVLTSDLTFMNRYTYNWANNAGIETWAESAWFDIQYEKVQGDLLRFTLPTPTARNSLNDAAYDILTFPYGAIDFVIPNDGNTTDLSFTSTAEASIGIARSIATAIGDACYDIQLLPYCPYREVAQQYAEDGYINFGLTTQFPTSGWSGVYKISSSGETPSRANSRSIGLWCISSHGTFNINHTIEVPDEEDSIEYKLYSAARKFRLVAPNYSSIFEFNPLKNKGVSVFNVDYTYKPYNPYIHIAPFFNSDGLYGVDTNDQRGLIVQGDFSVGYYSDAWANYQIQNANYANIFNRQLENIDFNQRQEREKFRVDRTTEGITEVLGLGGGMQGAKAFSGLGPWGMLGGGIGGTVGGMVAHGVGTYYDKKWMEESMAEERDYAIDNYNMALGNVKSLPYSLAKSDALTENFKYFPFIEEYDCTEVEKEIYRNKLKYDGMTVGAIGALESYIPADSDWEFQMLKGRMIMQENIIDDFHISDAIYAEVNKGFYYVKPEGE